MRLESPRTAAKASTACRRGRRYSDWISSPLLGVNRIRKCGMRSDQGPGLPNCGVQGVGSITPAGARS